MSSGTEPRFDLALASSSTWADGGARSEQACRDHEHDEPGGRTQAGDRSAELELGGSNLAEHPLPSAIAAFEDDGAAFWDGYRGLPTPAWSSALKRKDYGHGRRHGEVSPVNGYQTFMGKARGCREPGTVVHVDALRPGSGWSGCPGTRGRAGGSSGCRPPSVRDVPGVERARSYDDIRMMVDTSEAAGFMVLR